MATARLPNRPAVAAAGADRDPDLAPSVGITVALGASSSLASALVLDHCDDATDEEESVALSGPVLAEIGIRLWSTRSNSSRGLLGRSGRGVEHPVEPAVDPGGNLLPIVGDHVQVRPALELDVVRFRG